MTLFEFDGESLSEIRSVGSTPTGRPFLYDREVLLPVDGGYEIFSEDLSSSTHVYLGFSPKAVFVYNSTVVAVSESSVSGLEISETIDGIKDAALGPDGVYVITDHEVYRLSEAGIQKIKDSTVVLNAIAVDDSGEIFMGSENGLMIGETRVLGEPIKDLFYSDGLLYALTENHMYLFDTVSKELEGKGCDVSPWISDFSVSDDKLYYTSGNDSVGVLDLGDCEVITNVSVKHPMGINVRGE